MQVWKTTKRKPQQLADAPELPEYVGYLWEYWREVFTGDQLTFSEMQAWSNMTGKCLVGWEAEAIKSIDRIYWKVKYVSN